MWCVQVGLPGNVGDASKGTAGAGQLGMASEDCNVQVHSVLASAGRMSQATGNLGEAALVHCNTFCMGAMFALAGTHPLYSLPVPCVQLVRCALLQLPVADGAAAAVRACCSPSLLLYCKSDCHQPSSCCRVAKHWGVVMKSVVCRHLSPATRPAGWLGCVVCGPCILIQCGALCIIQAIVIQAALQGRRGSTARCSCVVSLACAYYAYSV